ncbi:MAG: hypothetical protein LBF26_01655 [Puniceicoccales bacterium]|jgi:hypothetical protein|nr:hypothetical protein [Puniceicoccales bacterium]
MKSRGTKVGIHMVPLERELFDPARKKEVEDLFYRELGNVRRILREGLDRRSFGGYSRFAKALEAGIRVVRGYRAR